MVLTTCEFCGMDFDASLTQCPICGKEVRQAAAAPEEPAQETKKEKKKPGKFAAGAKHADPANGTNPYKVPKWVMVLICCVLGVLVLAGALFAMYNIGYFGEPISMLKLFGASTPAAVVQAEPAAPPAVQEAGEAAYINEEDYQPAAAAAAPEVQDAPLTCTGLTLGMNSVTFEEAEQFYNMTVVVQPEGCTEKVEFTSLDPTIASVNDNGKIVAISGGSTEVIVSCGTVSESCLVTCDFSLAAGEQPPQEPPKLNNTDMTFFTPGEQFALVVENLPEGETVTFASDRPDVASVSESGVVTAKGIGTATITATVGETKLESIVRCNLESTAESGAAAQEDPNCTISHADVTMTIKGEYFRLTLRDSKNERVSGVSWKSADESVCTVNEKGDVTAVGSGTTTVSTVYGGTSYQCIVRCNLDR